MRRYGSEAIIMQLFQAAHKYGPIDELRGTFRPGTIVEQYGFEGSEYFRVTAINKTTGSIRMHRVDAETAKKEIETYYR